MSVMGRRLIHLPFLPFPKKDDFVPNSQRGKDDIWYPHKVLGFKTEVGRFYIEKVGDMYDLTCNDETLGSYDTPQQAADDIAFGGVLITKTRDGKTVVDTSTLDIPTDLDKWKFHFRHGKTLYTFGHEPRAS
jgi:hypothetical protein